MFWLYNDHDICKSSPELEVYKNTKTRRKFRQNYLRFRSLGKFNRMRRRDEVSIIIRLTKSGFNRAFTSSIDADLDISQRMFWNIGYHSYSVLLCTLNTEDYPEHVISHPWNRVSLRGLTQIDSDSTSTIEWQHLDFGQLIALLNTSCLDTLSTCLWNQGT